MTHIIRKNKNMATEFEKLIKLGKKIAYYRKLKGYSQNELAEILNISREHLAKLETARRRISLQLLFELAEVLNVSEKQLFDFDKV